MAAALPLSKIADAELREFAATETASGQTQSVIVEAVTTVSPREPARLSAPREPRKSKPSEKSETAAAANRQNLDELEQAVRDLKLRRKPVRLESAQALVADVTPQQLRALAELPMVQIIRPNRRHHASGRPRSVSK